MSWKKINRKRLPKTGTIIAGSWRRSISGEAYWSMSSVSGGDGFPYFADDDRTHYFRIPLPPKKPKS